MSTVSTVPTVSTVYANTSQAAKAGDLDAIVRMMASPDFEWDDETTAFAAEYGHLEVLKFAYEHGCPWVIHTCSSAAFRGKLDCLKFAYEHGAPLPNFVSAGACSGGNLECLIYACEKGCQVDENNSRLAASRSLECLEYLHSIQCPMDVYTSIYAAKEFKLDCLRFALEHGCPFERATCVRLNKHTDKIDLDEHIWLRYQLFSLIENEVLIPREDLQMLYDKVQAKIEEIKLQKQFALHESFELPTEVVNYIIVHFF
jgi:hypothetical protein